MTLGERIRIARGEMSQASFANKLGLSTRTLGLYERNERVPDADTIRSLCSLKSVSAQWLLFGDGEIFLEGGKLRESSSDVDFNIKKYDLGALQMSLEIAEEALDSVNRKMTPENKAKLVVAIYELVSEKANIDKNKILRLVQSSV